ncbi:MAG: anti-sigma F factor [Firmicutes bacterium]|nr:anti-sigma F factor [Bacillota bacterium]
MSYRNEVTVTMAAISQNEAFARITVAAFVAPLDPTVGELTDIKTAVSEAVTNAIIHGYENKDGEVVLRMETDGKEVAVWVSDTGAGIEDIERAMQPLYTSKPEMERSGMGFTVMATFMDYIKVTSEPGEGTTVEMRRKLNTRS